MQDKIVTLIIPLRLSQYLNDAESRLARILHAVPANLYDVLVVDYGSPKKYQSLLDSIVLPQKNVQVYRMCLPEGAPFSIGHARDLGVQHAKTPVVLFNDIDFIGTTQMYKRIEAEIRARDLIHRATDFFCVPVVYLTEKGTTEYLEKFNSIPDRILDSSMQQNFMTNGKYYVQFVAYGSSAIVANRYHYMSIGGHSKSFFGHGAEDYDLLHRLSYYSHRGPRTKNYYTDTKSNQITSYVGFRAYFALYGIDVFCKGKFLIHLWHSKRDIPDYYQSKKNFLTLEKLMREFDKNRAQPRPLEDVLKDDKTLIVGDASSVLGEVLRQPCAIIGEYEFCKAELFESPDDLLSYLDENEITVVGFTNPYGNDHRLKLYRAVRERGLKYWTFDRGALPDSWFFDPHGFNADSSAYARDKWDVVLAESDLIKVRSYISTIRYGDMTLETNGPRQSPESLRDTFNIGKRRVLFVPFQRPKDTVCVHFAGRAGSSDGFNSWVAEVAERLDPRKWIVLGKRHPLEDENPEISNVIFVEPNVHIHDLVELADKILVLNSGVGLLAAMFGKPVLYAGDAFYGHEGMNYSCNSPDDAYNYCLLDLDVDDSLVCKFLFHLIGRVYSFGKTEYRTIIREEDGARLSLATSILFRELRGLSCVPVYFGEKTRGFSLDEPIFYSFGGRSGIRAQLSANPKKQAKGAASSEKPRVGAEHRTWRRAIANTMVRTYSITVYPLMTSKKRAKLRRRPVQFFQDARSPISKLIGKTLAKMYR